MRIWDASHLPRQWFLPLLFSLLLVATSLLDLASAKKSSPTITTTVFGYPLHGLFYFKDSEVVLAYDRTAGRVHRSTDAGAHWDTVNDIPDGKVAELFQHPYDRKKAYVLSREHRHWYTHDRGETWTQFRTPASPSPSRPPLSFHAGDSDRIIYLGVECHGFFECDEVAYVTTDGFSTEPTRLRKNVVSCDFARSSELFTTGHDGTDQDRILCIVKGSYSPWSKDYRLVISDNYFLEETEPELALGRTVKGLVNMAAVKKFLVVAAKAEGTDEMALYVTNNTETWHQAEFPSDHRVEQDAYTILESTDYSIQVDVMTTRPSSAMGVLFTSNSNGTYFTRNIEHTNRNRHGFVDFEKVQGIQGIVLVNVVDNWEEVERSSYVKKKVQTKISFDDGRTFKKPKVGKEDLHLHSVSDSRNAGRVFSSPAPGIVMGVGNTGKYLKPYDDGDLYVSDDAGLTWWKARDGPHKYEFGDQGSVLIAVPDGKKTKEIHYSINHGHDWETANLREEVHAQVVTTSPDSTSLKFILAGTKGKGFKIQHVLFSIDFDGLHERKCKSDDFEQWWARLDDEGKPDCLMGSTQYYMRRKSDADCFIEEEFNDPKPGYEKTCTCTDEDYECDYNFKREGDNCVPAGPVLVPDGECKDPEGVFMGSSGYRLIPGNECKPKGGPKKDEMIERKCQESVNPPASGKLSHEITPFTAYRFSEYYYLERTETSRGDDETIIMRTDHDLWITHDHGKNWEELLKGKHIIDVYIYPHSYFKDVVFFVTNDETVYYSINRGKKIHSFKAPSRPNEKGLPVLGFHPNRKDWLIWTGAEDCRGSSESDCHSNAHLSKDRGDTWTTLRRYVRKCQFITEEGRGKEDNNENLIYCEQYPNENTDGPLQLVASYDFFAEEPTVHFKDIVDFATMSEFIIVAAKAEDRKYLKAATSVDGKTFADALFPRGFDVPEEAYTVLDSSTHAVFLHVTVGNKEGHEYGTLLKSNSNGTSYVLILDGVNRNEEGYADFEKLKGLEGVLVVNIVDNFEAANNGVAKKLKTMISHNDGAEWSLLTPPDKDIEGKAYECKGSSLDECSLHLHAYTERKNPTHTYSSPSAVGLMMGTGNVGEHLKNKTDADTFISRDAGITWETVKKGSYFWKYGDQGSIIVILEDSNPTNTLYYSLNEGRTWKEHQFSNKKMLISDISTVPSDNSRNFLLWGSVQDEHERISTVNVDFSGLRSQECRLDETNPEGGDYYLWKPRHPLQSDDCLFGHVAQYHRKRPEADCYNGRLIPQLHSIAENCTCTRQDFECDYNFQRQNDGSCGLVPGLSPADHSQICLDDPNAVTWYEPTGYRRIPLSTCAGGRELAYLESKAHACPHHEEEFEKEHRGRLTGFRLLLIICIPILAATGVGYWVWRNWNGKFGRIRLGEGGSGSSMIWDAERPWIKYPIMAIAVVVAVVISLPDTMRRVGRSVWSRVRGGGVGGAGGAGRYTTRGSFARGRADYDVVETDEGELLGEDSDEEVV